MTTPSLPAPGQSTPTPRGGGRLPKLRSGQLREQVLAALAADPNLALKVGEIADALGGRSGGAVGEALKRLTDTGHAQLLPGSPRRYQITPTGAAAAGTAAPAASTPTTTAATATARPPKPGAVLRPNGEWYLPRRLAGGTDIEVLRRLRGDGIPVLLYGPPGTGKTALVEAAFADVVTVGGHGDTCTEDLVGSFVPLPGGGFEFAYGPLVVAMREGRPLFIDDATLISPKVLAVLYPAMDGRATITIPAHHHETVTARPGFYTVAGHNPGVHGAVLTDALSSRFGCQIEVTTDFDLAASLGVPAQAITAAKNLNTQLGTGAVGWAPQLRELLALRRIAATLGIRAAVANLAAISPDEDRPAVAKALQQAFGHEVTPLRLGEQR